MKVLMPIPSKDFDPTETAIPWSLLTEAGVTVVFGTPDGIPGQCDERMLTGKDLGVLKGLLAANRAAFAAYNRMATSTEFMKPLRWQDLNANDFDGLILPGGHAKGMREYLESPTLQKLVADFFKLNKPVGAICHGVVLAARSQIEGHSVLFGKKTTALLKTQELAAWNLTRLWLGSYYRTYLNLTVEDEVKSRLASKRDFRHGPMPVARDSEKRLKAGFVVQDGNYISARWPGDAHKFSSVFLKVLKQEAP